MHPYRLLDDLVNGNALLHRVTIREGWRLDQIAAAVQDSLAIPAPAFLAAARDSARRARVGAPGQDLEGYLFPDTYLFPDGSQPAAVVDAMLDHFEEVWHDLKGKKASKLDRHDVVTLASIVEAETPLPEEKPRVAAVYLNRLEQGWKLQADPTVRYGLGYWVEHLYYKQLEVDTPYNTYLHPGRRVRSVRQDATRSRRSWHHNALATICSSWRRVREGTSSRARRTSTIARGGPHAARRRVDPCPGAPYRDLVALPGGGPVTEKLQRLT
jgi:uncharacterized YceG family protein